MHNTFHLLSFKVLYNISIFASIRALRAIIENTTILKTIPILNVFKKIESTDRIITILKATPANLNFCVISFLYCLGSFAFLRELFHNISIIIASILVSLKQKRRRLCLSAFVHGLRPYYSGLFRSRIVYPKDAKMIFYHFCRVNHFIFQSGNEIHITMVVPQC